MNREIKFRCWTKDEMLYEGWNGDFFATKEIIFRYDNVMQYTGLKDKNGIEIYEGDWCKVYIETGAISEKKSGYMFGVVEFKKNRFQITAKRYEGTITRVFGDDKIYGYQSDEFYHLENIEIIGNIYENPDLLNQGENVERSVATKMPNEQNDD